MIVPCGSLTKNRRMPHGSFVGGYTTSNPRFTTSA